MQHNPRLTKDKETFKSIMSSKFSFLLSSICFLSIESHNNHGLYPLQI